jgi:hypothetical protein
VLWRLKPPAWFNDAIVLAFFERLGDQFPRFSFTGVQRTLSATSLNQERTLSRSVMDDVLRCLSDQTIEVFAMPVLFGGGSGSHWTCIIVDKSRKKTVVYDSIGASSMLLAMRILAKHAVMEESDWEVEVTTTPQQFDGHSCGFYACRKVWGYVDQEFGQSMADMNDFQLRFKLLDYLLGNGCI